MAPRMGAAGASASSDGTGTLLSGASEERKGHNLVHTGKQVQDMVWADTMRSFYGVFSAGFHYLMTYGLDGIDTHYS